MPYLSIAKPVDAGAEGKALPDIGVKPAGLDHLAMDHAAAQHFHPAFADPPITRLPLTTE